MTTVAIMQPTYLGWVGYFDLIDQADVFVLLDTVPISKQSWQTRNRILGRDGNMIWLSVPVEAHSGQILNEVEIAPSAWPMKHRRSLHHAYGHLPHYSALEPILELLTPWRMLSRFTDSTVRTICEVLGISTPIYTASSFPMAQREDPIERIADLCWLVGATEFLEPIGGRELFHDASLPVPVRFHEYSPRSYRQGKNDETSVAIKPFVPYLSVVDALARLGPESTLDLIRSGRKVAV